MHRYQDFSQFQSSDHSRSFCCHRTGVFMCVKLTVLFLDGHQRKRPLRVEVTFTSTEFIVSIALLATFAWIQQHLWGWRGSGTVIFWEICRLEIPGWKYMLKILHVFSVFLSWEVCYWRSFLIDLRWAGLPQRVLVSCMCLALFRKSRSRIPTNYIHVWWFCNLRFSSNASAGGRHFFGGVWGGGWLETGAMGLW